MYSSSPIGLSLCSWNANGLLRRNAELRIFIEKHSPDIFLIQETHLRPSHNFNIANYTCHRNDRISDGSRTAGRTLILVKNSLKHYCLPTLPLRALEATNVILTAPKHEPISITSVYIPPSSDENLFTIDIEYFIQTANNCVLFGDFNASHNAWNCNHITNRGRHLYNFVNMVNLNVAFPPTPTRFGHHSANTIDIALIKNFYYPFTINSIDDLSSDHNPVFLNFNFKLAVEPPNPRAHLAKKIGEALNTTDNSLWRTQKFFKSKRPKIPPLNCATGTAVTDQQKANLLATNIKNNFIENDRENDSYNQNDEIINSTVNNFLSTPPATLIEPALPDEIIHYIKPINAKKAPGKDLITNRMLKNFPIKLILILTILINKILKFNHFPDNWKEAIIFSINKPDKDPHLASSYRPISLLSTIGKLTESIILHRLKKFINEHNLLNPNQYGFTNKLSTLHPLLRLTEHISEGFQKRKSTGVVFLDIQKAFDRVWINGLTFKLISYNLPPPLIHLIHSYLTNRSFKIRINETLSKEHSVSAGCPQDSLLGPLLFNLYINDIPDYSLTKINLYADDTAIHATYKKLSTISFAINKHLLHLQNFYDKWKISINVEKSTAIIFTKKDSLTPPIIMYNKQIPWSQEAKYLGIIFDTHLTWKQHILYTRDKFRKKLCLNSTP
ncbi:probable RNA-directed DNA polymerase from transposon X-element [Trichonephila clavipes]|uniref:Probable RNA-directed DNA polymerase from transposon X-element n=1 Tax=Trichonephila clavipes TaxID=2585209 RepID=A0A8X6RLD8_TRICX|nr:probable RNA-directed DNA polymerase from transposon X-element [Trichonephila clavipes]